MLNKFVQLISTIYVIQNNLCNEGCSRCTFRWSQQCLAGTGVVVNLFAMPLPFKIRWQTIWKNNTYIVSVMMLLLSALADARASWKNLEQTKQPISSKTVSAPMTNYTVLLAVNSLSCIYRIAFNSSYILWIFNEWSCDLV